MTEPTPKAALQKAIDIAGGRGNLAAAIGCRHESQIGVMLNRDKQASIRYALKIHQVTGVPLHELRPDIYPEK